MGLPAKNTPRNAAAMEQLIDATERQRTAKGRHTSDQVYIKPASIKTIPALFQVRELTYGLRDTDPKHVKTLKRAIEITGKELDPPVVVKIGKQWVCVDGHHRIKAYNNALWTKQIKCLWFGGTIQEAVDESIRLNSKDRLNVPKRDLAEAAWKLVLLGKHSKQQIVELCNVAEGTVASMRRVKRLYEDDSDSTARFARDQFRKRLAMPLEESTWANAKLARIGIEIKDRTDEQRAETLARQINNRLTDLLKRNPKITAMALLKYAPELPKALMDEWRTTDPRLAAIDEDDADETPDAPAAKQVGEDL